MNITLDMLKRIGTCESSLSRFTQVFGTSVKVNYENLIRAKAHGFNLDWLVDNLPGFRAEFHKNFKVPESKFKKLDYARVLEETKHLNPFGHVVYMENLVGKRFRIDSVKFSYNHFIYNYRIFGWGYGEINLAKE